MKTAEQNELWEELHAKMKWHDEIREAYVQKRVEFQVKYSTGWETVESMMTSFHCQVDRTVDELKWNHKNARRAFTHRFRVDGKAYRRAYAYGD